MLSVEMVRDSFSATNIDRAKQTKKQSDLTFSY